jgi:hypothetical protein
MGRLLRYAAVTMMAAFMWPLSAFSQPTAMNEQAMKAATAQAGLTTFTLSDNTAQLFLDIHMETYATITNLSAGYYDNTVNGLGWDLQWKNIRLGTDTANPLTVDGLLVIANFDDLEAADPSLERIVIGSNRLQGTLTADMLSYSGMYNPALTGGSGERVIVPARADLGTQTFNFNSDASQESDQGLFFILNMRGSRPSVQVVAGYDSKTLAKTSPDVWWRSP